MWIFDAVGSCRFCFCDGLADKQIYVRRTQIKEEKMDLALLIVGVALLCISIVGGAFVLAERCRMQSIERRSKIEAERIIAERKATADASVEREQWIALVDYYKGKLYVAESTNRMQREEIERLKLCLAESERLRKEAEKGESNERDSF